MVGHAARGRGQATPMTDTAATDTFPQPSVSAGPRAVPSNGLAIPASWVLAAFAGWLLIDQLLLWRFIGLTSWPLWVGGVAVCGVLIWRMASAGGLDARIPLSRLGLCIGFALMLLMLGGEGRFFYSNIDWQVRDAVLRDMALHPWPFVYVRSGGELDLLRAPIGMFLVPALAFKQWGPVAGDLALLVQNALLTGSLLALGSLLFDSARSRAIALVVVTLFSGADVAGNLLFHSAIRSHLEFWFETMQFSSTLTQTFWVPQHALAGWAGALLFLLWQRGQLRLWLFLAILPLTALWSPLGLIGAMPFAAWAGIVTLQRRALAVADIVTPAVVVLLCAPGLVYLASAGDGVGIRPYPVQLLAWLIFIAIELLVWAIPLLLHHRAGRFGMAPLLIASVWLMLCPFIQIGWSLDFMMRTSITSLMVVALIAADALAHVPSRSLRLWLMTILSIGSVTGLSEAYRAITLPASPRGTCSFFGAWDVSFARYPKGSYLAPLDKLPSMIRPDNPARVLVDDPSPCWPGLWVRPSGV